MTQGEKLIKQINTMINDALNKSNVLVQYTGIVQDNPINGYANVILSGEKTSINLPVRQGLSIVKGQSVLIISRINDFNNAIIFEGFKTV